MLFTGTFDRLDKEYRVPLDKTDLPQSFQKIVSPINFLIALHNFIVVYVCHASPGECNPKWRYDTVITFVFKCIKLIKGNLDYEIWLLLLIVLFYKSQNHKWLYNTFENVYTVS